MMAWDYGAAKHDCVICGLTTIGAGQTLPFCSRCELLWQDSKERAEAATARQRFVDRMRKTMLVKEKKNG